MRDPDCDTARLVNGAAWKIVATFEIVPAVSSRIALSTACAQVSASMSRR
ncbi:MAG: hypothetical protein R2708_07615 [Vicinamibacterales bacterium]